jgi:hypothetical protein
MSAKHQKTSLIIQDIIDYPTADDMVTLGEFLKMLGDRAFFLAIILFSLPNSLPIPGIPGFSTITGLPITFIALQVVLGHHVIWMPKKLAGKRFSRRGLARILGKAMPSIIFLERFLTPRLLFVSSNFGERLFALVIVLLSLILIMPIPGGNFLPGLSISLIALGMLERDGLFLLAVAGFIIGTLGLMFEIITLGLAWMYEMLHWLGSFF